jgi:hypothetical protein
VLPLIETRRIEARVPDPLQCLEEVLPVALCAALLECRSLAPFQCSLSIQETEEMNDFRHAPGPAGLVARAKARSVIAVKVFIEQDEILPVGIGLELLGPPVYRTPSLFIS